MSFEIMFAAGGVLPPPVLDARGPLGVPLDFRNTLIRRRGTADRRKVTAERSKRHPCSVLWVEGNAAVVAHDIRQLAEVVAFHEAGSHGIVGQHVVFFLRFDWLTVIVHATGEMEIFVWPRERVAMNGGDPRRGPLKDREVFQVSAEFPSNSIPPVLGVRRVFCVAVTLSNPDNRRTGGTRRLVRSTGRGLLRAVSGVQVVDGEKAWATCLGGVNVSPHPTLGRGRREGREWTEKVDSGRRS